MHIGQLVLHPDAEVVHIFNENGGGCLSPEEFKEILADATKLALDRPTKKDDEGGPILSDPHMQEIAENFCGIDTVTHTNKQFGKFFVQLWAFKILVNNAHDFSRSSTKCDEQQVYRMGSKQYTFKTGLMHNAQCIYGHMLQTQETAFRLTYPVEFIDQLTFPATVQLMMQKIREWREKFQRGLAASYKAKSDGVTNDKGKKLPIGWVHHFRLVQGSDAKWNIESKKDFDKWSQRCKNFKLSDYLEWSTVDGMSSIEWVVPRRSARRGG